MSTRSVTVQGLSVSELAAFKAVLRAAANDKQGGLKVLRAGLKVLEPRKPRKTKKTTLQGKKPETLEG